MAQLISKVTANQTTPPDIQRSEQITRTAWKAGVLGALNVLVVVIAVRLIVLVAVTGGIVLTATALNNPDPWRLGALAIYSIAVVIPVVWLASRR